jgi:hypothetical protein
MREVFVPPQLDKLDDEVGCAYVVDEPGGRRMCGSPRRASSSYCPAHHSLCYIVCGSRAEVERLQEVEALASAVGGRRARQGIGIGPSRHFLKRLEQAARGASCPRCS